MMIMIMIISNLVCEEEEEAVHIRLVILLLVPVRNVYGFTVNVSCCVYE